LNSAPAGAEFGPLANKDESPALSGG
jgi:hypothetical protein